MPSVQIESIVCMRIARSYFLLGNDRTDLPAVGARPWWPTAVKKAGI